MADVGATVYGEGVFTAVPQINAVGDSRVTNFALVFNRTYRRGDQQRREVAFVEAEAWSRRADPIGKHADKETKVRVRAQLPQKSWYDKEGKKRSRLVLRIESLGFIPRSSNVNGREADFNATGTRSRGVRSTERGMRSAECGTRNEYPNPQQTTPQRTTPNDQRSKNNDKGPGRKNPTAGRGAGRYSLRGGSSAAFNTTTHTTQYSPPASSRLR